MDLITYLLTLYIIGSLIDYRLSVGTKITDYRMILSRVVTADFHYLCSS